MQKNITLDSSEIVPVYVALRAHVRKLRENMANEGLIKILGVDTVKHWEEQVVILESVIERV